MAKMALELQVLRKNRSEAEWDATGNPRDASWVQDQLHNWLASNGWAEGRWGEFELVVRRPGEWNVLARVRG